MSGSDHLNWTVRDIIESSVDEERKESILNGVNDHVMDVFEGDFGVDSRFVSVGVPVRYEPESDNFSVNYCREISWGEPEPSEVPEILLDTGIDSVLAHEDFHAYCRWRGKTLDGYEEEVFAHFFTLYFEDRLNKEAVQNYFQPLQFEGMVESLRNHSYEKIVRDLGYLIEYFGELEGSRGERTNQLLNNLEHSYFKIKSRRSYPERVEDFISPFEF